ncbi:hypothetical protein S7A_04520 [Pantoea sp. Sc1]|nr:hypothetical protein S7A_04520 [Pantoea sp. Sc1]
MGYNARWPSKTWLRLIDQKIIFVDLISTFFVQDRSWRANRGWQSGIGDGKKRGLRDSGPLFA